MNRHLLVKWFGFLATLVHYDTLVLDRWIWLRKRLPPTRNEMRALDAGCGSGAFTIGAARRGYLTLGLTYDSIAKQVATQRALICGAGKAEFDVSDIRKLDQRVDLYSKFDVIICLETIEHILDDKKLFFDLHRVLKPGGFLLLTTPNFYYRAITQGDDGPFQVGELGWHVRRGYTASMLDELCSISGFHVQEISYCSGFLSQKITGVVRTVSKIHKVLGWLIVLPLRWMPLILDPVIGRLSKWPYFSICLIAYKPRFSNSRP